MTVFRSNQFYFKGTEKVLLHWVADCFNSHAIKCPAGEELVCFTFSVPSPQRDRETTEAECINLRTAHEIRRDSSAQILADVVSRTGRDSNIIHLLSPLFSVQLWLRWHITFYRLQDRCNKTWILPYCMVHCIVFTPHCWLIYLVYMENTGHSWAQSGYSRFKMAAVSFASTYCPYFTSEYQL